jgi:hypothetical protein
MPSGVPVTGEDESDWAYLSEQIPHYNLLMNGPATKLNEHDEPPEDERFAAWQKEFGKPEQGYEEWFRFSSSDSTYFFNCAYSTAPPLRVSVHDEFRSHL